MFRSSSNREPDGFVRVAELASDSGLHRYTQRGRRSAICVRACRTTRVCSSGRPLSRHLLLRARVQGESGFSRRPIVEWHQAVPGVVLTEDWTQPWSRDGSLSPLLRLAAA